jgi:hypothetical protein
MIISHKFKIIFIHIYKTAGTYIKKLLKKIDPDIKLNKYEPHIAAKDAKTLVEPHIWNTYAKFCVVRNSWDWQVSYYHYVKMSPTNPEYNILKNQSFNEYLLWRKHSIQNQLDFVLNNQGVSLVDKVIKFDNLNNELVQFFKEKCNFDITPYISYKKHNPSKRNPDYKLYYDDFGKQLIDEMYKKDIQYFNFVYS